MSVFCKKLKTFYPNDQIHSNQIAIMNKSVDFQSYITGSGLDAKPHQEEGVAWILEKETKGHQGVKGGIVADEMGLGKTIMMIGAIMANVCAQTLIVMPLALLQQWKKEIERTNRIGSLDLSRQDEEDHTIGHDQKLPNCPGDLPRSSNFTKRIQRETNQYASQCGMGSCDFR